MCCDLASKSSLFEHTAQRQNRKPSRRRARVVLDPVSASRVRQLLERLVIIGLGLPDFDRTGHPFEVLALAGPVRGGAPIALARQVAMYLAHVGCALTLTEAARLYHRDRTTAAYACFIVEERRENPLFDRVIELLEQTARLGLIQIEPVGGVT